MSESLLDDLQVAYSKAQLPGDSARAYRDIEAVIDVEDISAHYIVVGPLPDYPDTFIDLFMLTSKLLYNYAVLRGGTGAWGVVPLAKIDYVTERLPEAADAAEQWSSLWWSSGSDNTLILQDLIENEPKVRSFMSKVLKAIQD